MKKCITAAGLIACAAGAIMPAQADVLYDTLFIVDNVETTNAIATTIGGYQVWGRKIDSQVCDDFPVPAGGCVIDSITADYIGYLPGYPAEGLLVEVFADLGGYPAETPTWSYLGTTAIEFLPHPWGTCKRTTVTLPANTYSLTAGTWFISMTMVDMTDQSDGYFLFRNGTTLYGAATYVRNGGQDHLSWWFGGLEGVWPGNDWSAYDPGESSFRVTGHAAICAGDTNGDNVIDLTDLATLLAHYGMASGATAQDGDFDADGDVDLGDLADMLAVYGTTC